MANTRRQLLDHLPDNAKRSPNASARLSFCCSSASLIALATLAVEIKENGAILNDSDAKEFLIYLKYKDLLLEAQV